MKSYEIAEKVGYNDPHYFAAALKNVGVTTSEYRRISDMKQQGESG